MCQEAKTDSEDEPQTEAVCVIEDEVAKNLKLKIFPGCTNEKDLIDI